MKIKNMRTIEAVAENICTGCGACYNACPKGAITMRPNGEGFLFPVIDHDKCIDCGICLKRCAAYNPHYKNDKNPKCYAAWARDEIRMKSSSGGIFSLLSNYVLEQGGYVCGAAWDENFNVEHIIIHEKRDLHKLNGSKYVQSNTKKVFADIKKLLNEGEIVFFSGVPCQVAGLYHFLGKEYDNLLTAENICHGVPSPSVWQEYLREKHLHGVITKANFRPKQYGWGTEFLEFTCKDSTRRLNLSRFDSYMKGFKGSLFVRKCCGSCHFAKLPRQGDITMGDFWGIRFFDTKFDDKKGTSCVLLNTRKGEEAFAKIRRQLTLCRPVPLSFAQTYQHRLLFPLTPHPGRSRFFTLREKVGFEKAFDSAFYYKRDVGIVGIWFYENYGAIITAYALYKVLESMGFDAILIDMGGFVKDFPMESTRLSIRFMKRHRVPVSGAKRTRLDLMLLNRGIKNWVLASDQLWRFPQQTFDKTFLLDFAHDNKRKVAVATSFGDPYPLTPAEKESVAYHMHRLDRISVREESGVEMCKNEFGVQAKHLLDPVFLCDRSIYDDLVKRAKVKQDGKYLLCYILDKTTDIDAYTEQVAKKMDVERVYLTDANVIVKGANAQQGVEVEDWLYYFKNAEAVITDSFHGTCFAMMFHKPFLSIMNYGRGADRFTSLMKIFGESDRLVRDVSQISDKVEHLKYFESSKFETILRKRKESDLAWLQEAMTFEKEQKTLSTYDMLSEEMERLRAKSQENLSTTPDKQLRTESFKETLSLLLNRRSIMRKYYRYKILREVTWGKTRKHYERKYAEAKKRYLKIKETVKNLRNVH